jgi:hypothetical protein
VPTRLSNRSAKIPISQRQSSAAQPIELQNAFHVRKPHLHFLAFAARALEGFSVGEGANVVSYILVDIARNLAGVCCRTPRFESASSAVISARLICGSAHAGGDLQKFAGGISAELSTRDAVTASSRPGLVARDASAVVDWFDEAKGYGFVTVEQLVEAAFLHASVLEKSGLAN